MTKLAHKRPNNEKSSQIKHVSERANPVAVPNEQIKERINLQSSAKPCFMISKSRFLTDNMYSSIRAYAFCPH
jgi:hypothetical protein